MKPPSNPLIVDASELNCKHQKKFVMKSKKVPLNEITAAYNAMKEALEYYQQGIEYFYSKINFGKSHLDAKAVDFMNQSNLKISRAIKLANAAPEIVEIP